MHGKIYSVFQLLMSQQKEFQDIYHPSVFDTALLLEFQCLPSPSVSTVFYPYFNYSVKLILVEARVPMAEVSGGQSPLSSSFSDFRREGKNPFLRLIYSSALIKITSGLFFFVVNHSFY